MPFLKAFGPDVDVGRGQTVAAPENQSRRTQRPTSPAQEAQLFSLTGLLGKLPTIDFAPNNQPPRPFLPLAQEKYTQSKEDLTQKLTEIQNDFIQAHGLGDQGLHATIQGAFSAIYSDLAYAAIKNLLPFSDISLRALPDGWFVSGAVAGIPKLIYAPSMGSKKPYEALYLEFFNFQPHGLTHSMHGALPTFQTALDGLDQSDHQAVTAFIKAQQQVHITPDSDLPVVLPFYLSLYAQKVMVEINSLINPKAIQNKYEKPKDNQAEEAMSLGRKFYQVFNRPLLKHFERYFQAPNTVQSWRQNNIIRFQNLFSTTRAYPRPLNFFSGMSDRLKESYIHTDDNLCANFSLALIGKGTRIIPTSNNEALATHLSKNGYQLVDARYEQGIAQQFNTLTLPTGFLAFWQGGEVEGADENIPELYHYAPMIGSEKPNAERLAVLFSGTSDDKDIGFYS